ncbi:alkaline phosphatase family protein [Leifsonia sp. ZF2019]|uniref:alkaline phosphatase family protein n=1 Tax=Leifsonia sp. ZF2019 TaxID=2781978 RepID=UPI001CBB9ABB|nr:alkaline phosphatase family protein [Leifsonia sp. ZF2019]UAJ81557.1 alkaline phosphatase family protein [Leifsonia sp. ZF2019]
MLPAAFTTRTSLAAVLPSSLAAVRGEENELGLPAVDHVVVIVVDGLGASSLRARAGHARTVAPLLGRTTTIDAGFPTTTAAALTTLTTGTLPGEHGMVGYRVRDDAGRLTNQLSGWDDRMDPATWQRSRTVFERAAEEGVAARAIGLPKYADSGFTAAVLRGAEFVGGRTMADRFEIAESVVAGAGPGITYLYVAELDQLAHAKGWESPDWTAALETLDALVAAFARRLGPRSAALLTADHGVLDVPESGHVLFDTAPELLEGVAAVAGEPRFLHLYAESGEDAAAVAGRWRAVEGERSWVATRAEAVAAGWFGPHVDDAVAPRIGDVLVGARKRIAYYDSRDTARTGRGMVGQHGSLTADETRVPLLRFGAAG